MKKPEMKKTNERLYSIATEKLLRRMDRVVLRKEYVKDMVRLVVD